MATLTIPDEDLPYLRADITFMRNQAQAILDIAVTKGGDSPAMRTKVGYYGRLLEQIAKAQEE